MKAVVVEGHKLDWRWMHSAWADAVRETRYDVEASQSLGDAELMNRIHQLQDPDYAWCGHSDADREDTLFVYCNEAKLRGLLN